MYGIQQETPQFIQGLLGSTSEPNYSLDAVISNGANKAAQLGQFAQMVNPAAGNDLLAQRQISTQELAQQAMAQKADANTIVGFALGKLLRGLFDDWKERYDARGTLNRMAEMDPNKRQEILAFLEKNNSRQYQRIQKYLAKNNGTWDNWNNSPQTTTPIIQTPQ